VIEDLRYTLRQFRKAPGFTSAAIVTLALGIGAAAAMLVLIQGVLLSPPPYMNPDRLVFISSSRIDGQPYMQGSTIGQWIDWRTSSRTLEPPALYRWTFNFLVLPDGSRSMSGMVVTSEFFKTLGLRPILGREFVPAEASRPKVPSSAVIIGHTLWERQYNRDPNIIGKTLQLSRFPAPLPIVGVMPPGVRFLPDPGGASEPNYDLNAPVDFWMLTAPDETQPRLRGWNAVSRLRDGVTLQQARAEIATLASRQVEADSRLAGLSVNVRPVLEDLNREGRSLLLPLFGFVVLVFFVACVNVAGLFVARGLQRHREYAMRAALGASRSRLFRQTITESVALSMLSAIVGAAFAFAIVIVFKAIGERAIPRADDVTIGWPVIAFGFAAGLLAAFVSGVLPALRSASPRHADALKGMRSTTGRAERRLLSAIATVQIVLTVALLTGAALLIRTTIKLAGVRPGYDVENILAVTVTTVTPDSFLPFHTQVLERVAALPGVSRAAFAWGVPLTGNKWPGNMEFVGRPDLGQVSFPLRAITSDYFGAMGVPMVAGRMFTADDKRDAPPVMVINQTLATRYFKDVDALGHSVGRCNSPAIRSGRSRLLEWWPTHARKRSAGKPSPRSICPSGRTARSQSILSYGRSPTRSRWSLWSGGRSPRSTRPPRSSMRRRWRRFAGSRWLLARLPCACCSGFRSWLQHWPWSASTACYRSRSARASKRSRCGKRSARSNRTSCDRFWAKVAG
jgi:putative ABC transport system permease protein